MRMNSAGSFAPRFRDHHGASYTDHIMTNQNAMHDRLCRSQDGGNSLGQSRLAMSEVQICGIPKLDNGEVAPTP
jgi:hypothetical protein